MAEYTADVDGLGTLRLLDAIRACGLTDQVKFYQASTSGNYLVIYYYYYCFIYYIYYQRTLRKSHRNSTK